MALFRSTDHGGTFSLIEGVEEADVVGFGRVAEGASCAALHTNAKVEGLRGFFRSDDEGATFLLINDPMHRYVVANAVITGDPNVHGRTSGRGIVVREPPE